MSDLTKGFVSVYGCASIVLLQQISGRVVDGSGDCAGGRVWSMLAFVRKTS